MKDTMSLRDPSALLEKSLSCISFCFIVFLPCHVMVEIPFEAIM